MSLKLVCIMSLDENENVNFVCDAESIVKQLIDHRKINIGLFRMCAHVIDWHKLISTQTLSEEFIIEFIDKFEMSDVVIYQQVSYNFVKQNCNFFATYICMQYQRPTWTDEQLFEFYRVATDFWGTQASLSEEFIERHEALVNWHCLSHAKRSWSNRFLFKHRRQLEWTSLMRWANLTAFQVKSAPEIDWTFALARQPLTSRRGPVNLELFSLHALPERREMFPEFCWPPRSRSTR